MQPVLRESLKPEASHQWREPRSHSLGRCCNDAGANPSGKWLPRFSFLSPIGHLSIWSFQHHCCLALPASPVILLSFPCCLPACLCHIPDRWAPFSPPVASVSHILRTYSPLLRTTSLDSFFTTASNLPTRRGPRASVTTCNILSSVRPIDLSPAISGPAQTSAMILRSRLVNHR